MKNVRLYLVVLLAVLVFFTACKKEEIEFDNNLEDTEFVEGSGESKDGFDDKEEDDNTSDQTEDTYDDDSQTINDEDEGVLTSYKIDGDNITKIKDYDVSSNLISFQQDKQKHQRMWDYYIQLIPASYRTKIVEFEVVHGDGALGGYVAPIDESDLSRWKMGLAIDLVDDLGKVDISKEFANLVIHEFGHVLSLNDEQVAVGGKDNCGTYYTGEGCSLNNSYISALYELGWKDIYEESSQLWASEDISAFYDKYQDRFVTPYAATNPGEDMAEVFAVFVTKDEKPTGGSIADQKVRLLYNYPELVELRNTIRKDPVLRTMQPGSWKRVGCKHKHKKQQHAGVIHSH